MPLLSSAFLFLALAPKYRTASRWLRSVCLILGINGFLWTALGVTLLVYAPHLSKQLRVSLDHWMSESGGMGLGLLISLILSPEFREICRQSRPGRYNN
jgi:hypothetical protein